MSAVGKDAIDIALADSFKELVRKQPLEKITIKQITDGAGVIRPTFYHHFQDKYELLEWIIRTELLLPMQPLLKNGMVRAAMELLFTNIEKEKAFYTHAVRMEGVVTFSDVATKCVNEMLTGLMRELGQGEMPQYRWLTPEIISAYYAQSMCFACIQWILRDMTIPPQEMADAYEYIISHSFADVMRTL